MPSYDLMIDDYIVLAICSGEETQRIYVEIVGDSSVGAVVVVSRFQHLFSTLGREDNFSAFCLAAIGEHDCIIG